MTDNNKITAYPEITEAIRTGETGVWRVKPYETTDVASRVFGGSLVDEETARVARAKDTLRVKLSPTNAEMLEYETDLKVLPTAVMAMDEYRLNLVAEQYGYPALSTPTTAMDYKALGIQLSRVGSREAHDKALLTALSLSATPQFRQLISGLKAGDKPEWAKKCQEVQKRAKKFGKGYGYYLNNTDVGNTYLSRFVKDEVMPLLMGASAKTEGYGRGGVEYAVANGEGAFAPLIWGETDLDQTTNGKVHNRKRPVVNGKSVRYPSRMMTDPQKRVFATKRKAKGGIVVIDISGSMSLDSTEVDAIMRNAPNATVFAYSHAPRDTTGKPNAWMLVRNGKRVSDDCLHRIGNVGNGVDAPALDYALKIRRGNEPIIWVCDGQVTDANDRSHKHLNEVVAKIVWQKGIIQCKTPAEAILTLRNIAYSKVHRKFYGRVGLEVEELKRKGRR